MLLAADVGGTKTLVGLFARAAGRPVPMATHSYATTAHATVEDMLDTFARDLGHPLAPMAAVFGVAGPVAQGRATLTNGTWTLHAEALSSRFGGAPTMLVNDLAALAAAVPVLRAGEVEVLHAGEADPRGALAVLAAGTGLGAATLVHAGEGWVTLPSEAGHADFAPRTARELALVTELITDGGRASVEQILSGAGLVRLYRFTHHSGPCPMVDADDPAPAGISASALGERCPFCEEALALFVSAYGAEAGNLALRSLATGGVFIGGGIAPRILPALQDGRFMDAFTQKPPMEALLGRVPVSVILTPEAGLLGAAVLADRLLG